MATGEEVPTLLLLSGEGTEVTDASSYTISSAEAEVISAAVSMAELKPIMVPVATETQVEEVPETVLASHLVSEKPGMKQTRGPHTKEVYQDG